MKMLVSLSFKCMLQQNYKTDMSENIETFYARLEVEKMVAYFFMESLTGPRIRKECEI